MRILSSRLSAQIIKELLSVWRDPRSRFILIGPPVMQLLIFTFAATLEVRNIDIAVHDRDHGRWSREFVSRVQGAGFVSGIRYAQSHAEVEDLINRGTVLLAIDFPPDFSRAVAGGGVSRAQVIIDGRKANAGQIAAGYLEVIAQSFNTDVSQASIPGGAAVRNWFNPNLIYRWFVTPSLAGILVTFIALLLTALSISRERELGTFDQLLVSPTTPAEIIVAKTAPALLIGAGLSIVMMLAARFVFGVPFSGSVLALFLCLILYIFSVVGVGLMISAVCATQQQAILGTFAAGVPMVLLSGFATPVENIPEWLRWIAEIIPLKHYLIILQGSFLKALPPQELLASAWPLAIIAAVTLAAAIVIVRRRLQ